MMSKAKVKRKSAGKWIVEWVANGKLARVACGSIAEANELARIIEASEVKR